MARVGTSNTASSHSIRPRVMEHSIVVVRRHAILLGVKRIMLRAEVATMRVVPVGGCSLIITDVETKSCWVNVAVSYEEQYTENGLGEDIKNAVENSLGVGRNDIATFGQTPGDGVDEPEEDGPYTADHEGSVDCGTKCARVFEANKDNVVCNAH